MAASICFSITKGEKEVIALSEFDLMTMNFGTLSGLKKFIGLSSSASALWRLFELACDSEG